MTEKKDKFDFSGYATKNDLKCGDGRVIRRDAFKDNDGTVVPLVWQHLHDDPANILGHAVLENRPDGVYAYCSFNDTPAGQNAKKLVQHGDITAMSIYANDLIQKAKDVLHGIIREVSLVLSGQNPGAKIQNVSMSHGDGTETDIEDEAIITTNEILSLFVEEKDKKIEHADGNNRTVQEVVDSMTEEQKTVMYAFVAEAMDAKNGEEVSQSAIDENKDDLKHSNEGDKKLMKHNVFEGKEEKGPELTHAQFMEIVNDVKNHNGSFRESFLAHAVTYGIENIELLFPDAQAVTQRPDFVQRRQEWVKFFFNGSRHLPFSRIKSLSADITLDTARALGYVKGALKKEEFFAITHRDTTPATVYKKQKLDRDDITDITTMDVVAWLMAEMDMMLDEEIARAGLIGDGRDVADPDRIDPTKIRPIYSDDVFYAERVILASTDTYETLIDQIIASGDVYNGSGSPVLFAPPAVVTGMLLLKDDNHRRIYNNLAELAATLGVTNIVKVPLMTGMHRDIVAPPSTVDLMGILVDPRDYSYGADRGGQKTSFEDFDIDYNQYKYLKETRCSGALTIPKSAIIFERTQAAG